MENEKLLKQEEIDSLVSAYADQKQTQPRVVPVPPGAWSAQAASGPYPVAASRPKTLDEAIESISQLEQALAESNATVRQLQHETQQLLGQIGLVNSRVEGILANLGSTIGYRAQKTFVCNNCNTNGQVAAHIKCTSCGHENWWGWWPQRK